MDDPAHPAFEGLEPDLGTLHRRARERAARESGAAAAAQATDSLLSHALTHPPVVGDADHDFADEVLEHAEAPPEGVEDRLEAVETDARRLLAGLDDSASPSVDGEAALRLGPQLSRVQLSLTPETFSFVETDEVGRPHEEIDALRATVDDLLADVDAPDTAPPPDALDPTAVGEELQERARAESDHAALAELVFEMNTLSDRVRDETATTLRRFVEGAVLAGADAGVETDVRDWRVGADGAPADRERLLDVDLDDRERAYVTTVVDELRSMKFAIDVHEDPGEAALLGVETPESDPEIAAEAGNLQARLEALCQRTGVETAYEPEAGAAEDPEREDRSERGP